MEVSVRKASATDGQRKDELARAIAEETSRGWRVESQTEFQVVLVKGKNHSHLLHLILTLLTLGLWLVVWIPLAIFGGEKRAVVSVDEDGRRHLLHQK